MTGPMRTVIMTLTLLYITWVPIVIASGPKHDSVGSAVVEFRAQLEPGAVAFQGTALGLLSALFIARVIAPVPDVRNQTSVTVGSAAAGHFLAGVVISTAVFTFIGTIHDGKSAGRVWFVIVLAAMAFGLAQAINADITFGRKRQRRRTKNDLIITSWAVHRRAAVLQSHPHFRRAPYRRLTTLTSAAIIVSASVGTGMLAAAYPGGIGVSLAPIFGWALAIAAWGTFWVSLLIATVNGPATPRFLIAVAWITVSLTTVAPAVALTAAPADPQAVPFKVAVVLTVLTPFLLLLGKKRQRNSMQTLLLAVELRRYRRHRLVLIRDYYALKKRRHAKRDREPRWEEAALRTLLRGVTTAGRCALPKPASPARHRPDAGIGSKDWWVGAGKPPTWRPAP
jgi:hypothetical protein